MPPEGQYPYSLGKAEASLGRIMEPKVYTYEIPCPASVTITGVVKSGKRQGESYCCRFVGFCLDKLMNNTYANYLPSSSNQYP